MSLLVILWLLVKTYSVYTDLTLLKHRSFLLYRFLEVYIYIYLQQFITFPFLYCFPIKTFLITESINLVWQKSEQRTNLVCVILILNSPSPSNMLVNFFDNSTFISVTFNFIFLNRFRQHVVATNTPFSIFFANSNTLSVVAAYNTIVIFIARHCSPFNNNLLCALCVLSRAPLKHFLLADLFNDFLYLLVLSASGFYRTTEELFGIRYSKALSLLPPSSIL